LETDWPSIILGASGFASHKGFLGAPFVCREYPAASACKIGMALLQASDSEKMPEDFLGCIAKADLRHPVQPARRAAPQLTTIMSPQ
jgi:hypothetical protein